MLDSIKKMLPADHPWKDQILWLPSTDSTNTQLKSLTLQGAPHGTVLIAGHQTGGRGRMGRSFQSDNGMGVYMSLLLRPQAQPQELMHLTCAAAVAMCRAIEDCACFSPDVKWINDLVYEKRKLGGILTELVLSPGSTAAIIGIGINCRQEIRDFPPELQDMAGSLNMFSRDPVAPGALAAAMLEALAEMDRTLLTGKAQMLQCYRSKCITLGKDIALVRSGEVRHGYAEDLDDDGELIVSFPDGHQETVNSGDVSVRGLYGYI